MMRVTHVFRLLGVFLLLAGSLYAIDVQFDPAATYGVGSAPRSVAAADFDGLSGNDLAVVNYLSHDISVLLNTGSGTFATAVNYSVGAFPTSVFSSDFDGLNGPDLAVTSANHYNVSILLNNGDGTFAAAVAYGVGTYPYSVFGADLDGDGDFDLATANHGHSSYGNVSVLINNGNGTFAAAVNYVAGDGPVAVTLADLDGDLDNDLIVANADDDNVSIFLNDGFGVFGAATNYAVGTGPYSVQSADLDGDSDIDLALANPGSNNISVLLNHGNGTFPSAINYGAGGQCLSVTVADLDGDNDNDLAATNRGTGNIAILLNNGSGSFGTPVTFPAGSEPFYVASADLDGDGDSDLAVANYSGTEVSVLMNITEPIGVVINEILYKPGGTGAPFVLHDHEWVEIFNSSDGPVDLTGWTISNRDGILADTAMPSWILPAGCYLTVHLALGTNDSDFDDLDGHYYIGSGFELFGDDQGECALYAGAPQASTIVDFVSWNDDSGPAPYSPGTAHNYAVSAGIWTTAEYYDSQGLGGADCLARYYDGCDVDSPGDWRAIPWDLYVHNQPLQPFNPIQEVPTQPQSGLQLLAHF